jgi:ABC-2 type transport system permease protein
MRAVVQAVYWSAGMYVRLIAVQIRSQFSYRTSFWLDLFAAGLGTVANFGTLALIMQRFGQVGGWSLGEVAFLYGMVETAFGVMDLLFSGFDPSTFGQRVRRGTFDRLLLRPVGITVQVLGSEFYLRRLGRIAQGAAVLGLALHLAHVRWTPFKLFYLPVVLASQVLFFGALFVIGATITFWTVQSIEAINIFTYGGTEMMAYPMHIYRRWMRRFFTFVVPAIWVNYYPALYFLDKPDPLHLPPFIPFLPPLAGVAMMAAALAFWHFGLRHYQSTGT